MPANEPIIIIIGSCARPTSRNLVKIKNYMDIHKVYACPTSRNLVAEGHSHFAPILGEQPPAEQKEILICFWRPRARFLGTLAAGGGSRTATDCKRVSGGKKSGIGIGFRFPYFRRVWGIITKW